jgi:hypothetical protein
MKKQKNMSFFRTIISVLVMICILSLPIVSNARKPVDEVPTAPSDLFAVSVSQTSIKLSWTQSYDRKGVASRGTFLYYLLPFLYTLKIIIISTIIINNKTPNNVKMNT